MALRQKIPPTDSRSRIRPPPFVSAVILLLVLMATVPLILACNRSDGKVNLLVTVGSQLEDCGGHEGMKCLVVNGEIFHNTIEGFDYEEGFYYRLTVEREDLYPNEDPPPGRSMYRYRLVEVISKERPPQ